MVAATALLLGSCSSDSGSDEPGVTGKPVEVTFNISAPADNISGTRGENIPPANTDGPAANEKIHNWMIVLVNSNGDSKTVRHIFKSSTIGDAGVERDWVKAEIPSGTYDVYAFANISDEELKNQAGLTFTVGSEPSVGDKPAWTFPTAADEKGVVSGYTVGGTAEKGRIPMTGKMRIKVTEAANQTFAVEVVRTVAKLSFSFATASGTDISVKSVSILPAMSGAVDLFPNYGYLDSYVRDGFDPTGTLMGVSEANPSGFTPATYEFANALVVSSAQTQTASFYVRETRAADHPTGRFVLGVGYTRGSNTDVEEAQYALTDDDITTIYRNDHIYIPIIFTDYYLELETRFYPPIGGYPAVITSVKDNEYYVKFGTQGVFEIKPIVRKGSSNGTVVAPSDYTVTIGGITAPGGFFTVPPAPNATTGEILGELSGTVTSGTAVVPLSLTLKNDGSGLVSRTFNRTIYIIRTSFN